MYLQGRQCSFPSVCKDNTAKHIKLYPTSICWNTLRLQVPLCSWKEVPNQKVNVSDLWDEILFKSLICSNNEIKWQKEADLSYRPEGSLVFLVKLYHIYTSANEIKIVSDLGELLDTLSVTPFRSARQIIM